MKTLLTTIALIEAVAGFALAIVPSLFVSILLGTEPLDLGALSIARLTGAAIICLAFACWLNRGNNQSLTMVKVMALYNFLATVILLNAVLIDQISGPALWPAVFLHIVLLIWCSVIMAKRI